MDSDFDLSYHQALTLFQNGRHSEAETLFCKLNAYRPQGFADIFNKLGFIFQWRGEFHQAIEHFQKALALNPNYTEAALNLAVTYNEIGLYEEAVQSFAKAASSATVKPKALDAHTRGKLANEHARLGDQYQSLCLYDEALREYRKALSLRPNFVDILTKSAITLRDKGELDEAIQVFMQAKEIHPRYADAIIHLGITYYMKGFFNLAKSEWETLKDVSPQNHSALLYLHLAQKGVR